MYSVLRLLHPAVVRLDSPVAFNLPAVSIKGLNYTRRPSHVNSCNV